MTNKSMTTSSALFYFLKNIKEGKNCLSVTSNMFLHDDIYAFPVSRNLDLGNCFCQNAILKWYTHHDNLIADFSTLVSSDLHLAPLKLHPVIDRLPKFGSIKQWQLSFKNSLSLRQRWAFLTKPLLMSRQLILQQARCQSPGLLPLLGIWLNFCVIVLFKNKSFF